MSHVDNLIDKKTKIRRGRGKEAGEREGVWMMRKMVLKIKQKEDGGKKSKTKRRLEAKVECG